MHYRPESAAPFKAVPTQSAYNHRMHHWKKIGRWMFFVIGALITITSTAYNAWQLGNAGVTLGLPISAWTAIGVVIIIGTSAFILVQNQREHEAMRKLVGAESEDGKKAASPKTIIESSKEPVALTCANDFMKMLSTLIDTGVLVRCLGGGGFRPKVSC